jgi:UDP-N-acetylenolpyruvoylglucosamine reductase
MVKMNILKNRSLKEHNTFGIDAKAKYYIEIKDIETLKALARNELQQLPLFDFGRWQ